MLTGQEQRDQLHWEEFDRTWSKRRRLAREKNEIETPRFGEFCNCFVRCVDFSETCSTSGR